MGNPKLTTIQATMCPSTVSNMAAMDVVSRTYFEQGVDMAHELHLFDPNAKIKSKKDG